MLTLVNTERCAVMEIDGLMNYSGKAKEAMLEFCRLNLDQRLKYKRKSQVTSWSETDYCRDGSLYSYYMFSASAHRTETNSYGVQFAQFIKDNDLGEVWASPVRENQTFHVGHYNQIWIWMPEVKVLRKWYEGATNAKNP